MSFLGGVLGSGYLLWIFTKVALIQAKKFVAESARHESKNPHLASAELCKTKRQVYFPPIGKLYCISLYMWTKTITESRICDFVAMIRDRQENIPTARLQDTIQIHTGDLLCHDPSDLTEIKTSWNWNRACCSWLREWATSQYSQGVGPG